MKQLTKTGESAIQEPKVLESTPLKNEPNVTPVTKEGNSNVLIIVAVILFLLALAFTIWHFKRRNKK